MYVWRSWFVLSLFKYLYIIPCQMNKNFCKKVCKHEVHCVVYVHAETWKKLASRRLIFPWAQLYYSRRHCCWVYDECAHGWLDGLNRLFMEASSGSRFMLLFSSSKTLVIQTISVANLKALKKYEFLFLPRIFGEKRNSTHKYYKSNLRISSKGENIE